MGKTHSPLKAQPDNSIHFRVLFQYPLGKGWGLIQYPHTAYSLNKASREGDMLIQQNLVEVL